MSRRGIVSAVLAILAALLLSRVAQADTGIPGTAVPPAGRLADCAFAGLSAGDWGSRRLAAYADPTGRSVEIWCTRSMFSAHYDIRVGRRDPVGVVQAASGAASAAARRVKTFAGCFFVHGDNKGPYIVADAAHSFIAVTWTSMDLSEPGSGYVFHYDWPADKLTITALAAGRPPAVRVVDPPDDFAALRQLLPDP